MDDMRELKQDVKEIKSEMRAVSETLMRNTVSLEHHVKRTDLAERRLDSLDYFRYWLLGGLLVSTAASLVKLFH